MSRRRPLDPRVVLAMKALKQVAQSPNGPARRRLSSFAQGMPLTHRRFHCPLSVSSGRPPRRLMRAQQRLVAVRILKVVCGTEPLGELVHAST